MALLWGVENRKAFFEKLPDIDVNGWGSDKSEEELSSTVTNLTHRLNRLLGVENRRAMVK